MTRAQQKAIRPGEIRSWEVDLGAMAAAAGWTRRAPGLLEEEVSRILDAFPTLVACAGLRLSDDRCWVEAAEPLLCPACNELVVFDRGARCARCERPVAPPAEGSMVGLVGRIPALISGRPFARALESRIARLRAAGDPRAELHASSVVEVAGRRYLAPRYGIWFSRSWPRADPPVMVWPEYFDVLGIPPDHVYRADQYFRLCLYATWREQPAVQVLQNRVAPRLLIDLMVADLVAIDRLDDALNELDMSLYEMYNLVGKPAQAAPLQRIYERMVGSLSPAPGAAK